MDASRELTDMESADATDIACAGRANAGLTQTPVLYTYSKEAIASLWMGWFHRHAISCVFLIRVPPAGLPDVNLCQHRYMV